MLGLPLARVAKYGTAYWMLKQAVRITRRRPRVVLVVLAWVALTIYLTDPYLSTIYTLAAVAAAFGVRYAWRRHHGQPAATIKGTKRRARIVQQWPLAIAAALEKSSTVPALKGLGPTEGGYAGYVQAADAGISVTKLRAKADIIAEVIGCLDCTVTVTRPGVARIEFWWSDPTGRTLPLVDLPSGTKGRIAYGIRQDGSPATISARLGLLIGGLTRHGKSNIVWTLLADLIRQGVPVRLYVSDPKMGVELGRLALRVDAHAKGTFVVRQYATTEKATATMVKDMESAMGVRMRQMAERGSRAHTPTVEEPLCIAILDEMLTLTSLLKEGTNGALGRIAFTGSVAGYIVWGLGQIGEKAEIGVVRDLLPQRLCVATPSPDVTDAVLGRGATALGARCHTVKTPGVGYSGEDGSRDYTLFRAALVSDREADAIAAGNTPTGMRPPGTKAEATALYRWYDATDALLYVGISNHVLRRTGQHQEDKEWMRDVARSTVQWYPNRKAALAAEKAAIPAERPLYNVQHSRRRIRVGSRA